MTTHGKILVTGAVLVTSWLIQFAAAQVKQDAPPAPVPAQIASAHRVFIANAGGDDPTVGEPLLTPYFSGGIDRPYNQFYAGIKGSGRYELVGSPAEADLLFEIRFAMMPAWSTHGEGGWCAYDPQLRLEIRDAKTNSLLWAFTEHANCAILEGNRNKNLNQALARIVSDALGLGSRATASAQAKP